MSQFFLVFWTIFGNVYLFALIKAKGKVIRWIFPVGNPNSKKFSLVKCIIILHFQIGIFAISTLAIIVELLEEFTSAYLASLRQLCCTSSYISHCNPMVHICSVHKFHCSPKYIQVCECSSIVLLLCLMRKKYISFLFPYHIFCTINCFILNYKGIEKGLGWYY